MSKFVIMSENLDAAGAPIEESAELLCEMSTLQSTKTGLPFDLHVRSRVTVAKTSHKDATATLKVYQQSPGKDIPWFGLTITDTPMMLGCSKNGEAFFASVSGRDLKKISSWIITNKDKLIDLWNHGMFWTTEQKLEWEKSLAKI